MRTSNNSVRAEMIQVKLNRISNDRGSSFITTMLAAAIIILSVGGVGASALRLGRALNKAEIANLAVAIEANLVASFHDKRNYPDPVAAAAAGGSNAQVYSPNKALREGTLDKLPLSVTFAGGVAVPVTVPVDGVTSAVGFLEKDLTPCPVQAYSNDCILRYEVKLRKGAGASYAFAYKVEANPDVLSMAPLGDINDFSIPIDPGNYRAELNLTFCDKDESMFITGVNRETGEVLCARKPTQKSCPDKKIAKGLYLKEPADGGPPSLELICTSNEMRTFKCPPNYALQKFNAQYVDPENSKYSKAPGKCVFFGKNTSSGGGAFPANPTSPYMKKITGTFCPPFYKANGPSSCNLVPDTSKNTNAQYGLGRCAPTKYKDCQRTTSTTSSDGGSAYNAWVACNNSATKPAGGCGTAPANPVITTTCSSVQISKYCDGSVSSGSACQNIGSWNSGTAYADASNAYNVAPIAITQPTTSGRTLTCTFTDASSTCTAPDLDINGKPWGKKQAKWYGGVQVESASCTFDPTQGSPEVVDAI